MGRASTGRKLRHGMIIRLEDYRAAPASMKRDFAAELMTIGHLGTIDYEDENIRLYIFRNCDQMEKTVKAAKSIGFESAGPVEEPVFIDDRDIQQKPRYNYPRTYRRQENYR